MLILVAGATGFIASQLIPRLLRQGHQVRAMARDPSRLDGKPWTRDTEIACGDVMCPSTLRAALKGVDTAYYLIHSMSSGADYARRDADGARNFALAAAGAGVRHIIYLGGLTNPGDSVGPYMRSRMETGEILRLGPAPVTELRASVIAGPGSLSFEMIRRIADLLPVIPGPTWMRNKAQPIAAEDVVDYLIRVLDNPEAKGKVLEVGGPEVMTYDQLMLTCARARGLKRRMMLVPGLPVWLLALGFRLLTPVPQATAAALVGELRTDSVVTQFDARQLFPDMKLTDFASVARAAPTQRATSVFESMRKAGMRLVERSGDGLLAALDVIRLAREQRAEIALSCAG
jgi:uncharacterized protein YbjT (DUF2867 family)